MFLAQSTLPAMPISAVPDKLRRACTADVVDGTASDYRFPAEKINPAQEPENNYLCVDILY
jgi:hypothetical protein